MGKIIRLTESDLNRIVRRVIKEQPKSKRIYDKMVRGCLLKDGFKELNTGGKYDLYMVKEVMKNNDKIEYIVVSQDNPKVFAVTCLKNKKVVGDNQIIMGPSNDCNQIALGAQGFKF